jgi:hypothetical protein
MPGRSVAEDPEFQALSAEAQQKVLARIGGGVPAGEAAIKPSFLQALGGAAKERMGEIGQAPGDMMASLKNVGSALSDKNLPLRMASATVPGAGPAVSTAMNLGTEGLAQYQEGEFRPGALALSALPAFLAGGARVKRAIPNFKTRVNPAAFRQAQATAQAGLEDTMGQAQRGAPPMPADLPPPPRTLGQEVDEFSGRLGNQDATDQAYQASRSALPGGHGDMVPVKNLQSALDELDTHVIPNAPDAGTLAPVAAAVQRLRGAQYPDGRLPVGDAIKELRELGIRLKAKSDELGNLSKGHLAFLWKALHADVEAAAAQGIPGAAEALKAAGALKGELAGESVSRIARGATREGAVDPEAMARGVRGKEEPLGRMMGDSQMADLQKLLERHRIESGVRAGAAEATATERAARTKAMDTTQGLPSRAMKNVEAGGQTTQGLDVGALETLLNRNAPAVEQALGPGGVQLLRDFIGKNRSLPAKPESLGMPSYWVGGLGGALGAAGGAGLPGVLAGLGLGMAPPAMRATRSMGRAISATPNPKDLQQLLIMLGQGGRAAGGGLDQ